MDENCDPAIASATSVHLIQSLTSMEHLEDEYFATIAGFGIVDKEGNL